MSTAAPPHDTPADPMSSLDAARAVVRASALRRYRVRLVSSGFGDMLTVANFQSAIGDLLGLSFAGITLPPSFSRPYYDDLVTRIGLRSHADSCRGEPELILDGNTLTDPQRPLASVLRSLVDRAPDADTLMITMRGIAAAQAIQGIEALHAPFFASALRQWMRDRGRQLFGGAAQSPSFTLHVRLGDVAAVRLGGFVVIPEFARRATHPAGLIRHAAIERAPFVKKTLHVVDDCLAAARRLRQRFPHHRIHLVSDGFDRTRDILVSPDVRAKLRAKGLDFADGQMEDFFAATTQRILDARAFDHIVFGEATSDDWLRSVELLLSSQVVVSTARGFVANMLTFFSDAPQHIRFYSPMGTGLYSDLSVIGLVQKPFSSFPAVVDDLLNDPVPAVASSDAVGPTAL